MTSINMQTMRYINLLNAICKVKTRKCFVYNDAIIFAVPTKMVRKAVGQSGKNIRLIEEKLGKKIKIIEEVSDVRDARRFIEDVVSPVGFISLELRDNVFVLTAGVRSKAMLLGKNKRRYEELKQIVEDNFGKELRIV